MGRFHLLAAAALLAATSAATAQTRDLVGSWTLVSSTTVLAGQKLEPFGPNPKGALMFDANGRYLAMVARADLPKIAAGSPRAATAEENKAIASGAIAHFGSYVVDGKTLTFRIETSSFPNWDGVEQKRSFTLSGDTLTYTADGGPAGVATLVWKRAK